MTKTKAESLGAALTQLVILAVGKPLILICGANWLLETVGHEQIPYKIATWFGATLIIMGINMKLPKKETV